MVLLRKSLYYLFYKYIPYTVLYSYDQVSAEVQNMQIQTDSLIFIRLLITKVVNILGMIDRITATCEWYSRCTFQSNKSRSSKLG